MLMSMRLREQRKRIGGAGREAAAGIGALRECGERICGSAAPDDVHKPKYVDRSEASARLASANFELSAHYIF